MGFPEFDEEALVLRQCCAGEAERLRRNDPRIKKVWLSPPSLHSHGREIPVDDEDLVFGALEENSSVEEIHAKNVTWSQTHKLVTMPNLSSVGFSLTELDYVTREQALSIAALLINRNPAGPRIHRLAMFRSEMSHEVESIFVQAFQQNRSLRDVELHTTTPAELEALRQLPHLRKFRLYDTVMFVSWVDGVARLVGDGRLRQLRISCEEFGDVSPDRLLPLERGIACGRLTSLSLHNVSTNVYAVVRGVERAPPLKELEIWGGISAACDDMLSSWLARHDVAPTKLVLGFGSHAPAKTVAALRRPGSVAALRSLTLSSYSAALDPAVVADVVAACTALEELAIHQCYTYGDARITDAIAAHGGLKSIEYRCESGEEAPLTADHFVRMIRGNQRTLESFDCLPPTSEDVAAIVEALRGAKQLRRLHVGGLKHCPAAVGPVLALLRECPHLERLVVPCEVTEDVAEAAAEVLMGNTTLRELHMTNVPSHVLDWTFVSKYFDFSVLRMLDGTPSMLCPVARRKCYERADALFGVMNEIVGKDVASLCAELVWPGIGKRLWNEARQS